MLGTPALLALILAAACLVDIDIVKAEQSSYLDVRSEEEGQSSRLQIENSWPGGMTASICMYHDYDIDCGWEMDVVFSGPITKMEIWDSVVKSEVPFNGGTKIILRNLDWAKQEEDGACHRFNVYFTGPKPTATAEYTKICRNNKWKDLTDGKGATPSPPPEFEIPGPEDYVVNIESSWDKGIVGEICLFHTQNITCGFDAEMIVSMPIKKFKIWTMAVVDTIKIKKKRLRVFRIMMKNTEGTKAQPNNPECHRFMIRHKVNKKPKIIKGRYTRSCHNGEISTDPNQGGTVPPTTSMPPTTQEASTTTRPQTQQPTTERPQTQQPTTERPQTQQPTTERPQTQQPTTERPQTQQPTTERQQTQQPTTERPQTQQPTTERPQTQQPTTERPQTQQPTTERQQTQQPTTERPQTQQPTTERPQTQQPTTERPQTQQPTTERPQTQQPTTERPQTQQPTTGRPQTQQPTTERPQTQQPTTQQPTQQPSTSSTPIYVPAEFAFDYGAALNMSMQFYFAQRSGPINDAIVPWRTADSAMNDGSDVGKNLVGGWYDAGDYVKFGFPMAASATNLLWGMVEYPEAYSATGELDMMYKMMRHPLEYFLKCWDNDNQVFYGQVGNGGADHGQWGRPENIDIARPTYKLDENNGGSDLAGETAAALAVGAMAFKDKDPDFAQNMLLAAGQLYTFADSHRKSYHESIPDAANFYRSHSGYEDELCWGAAWLYAATGDNAYKMKALQAMSRMNQDPQEFSWDSKEIGCYTVMLKYGDAVLKNVYANKVIQFMNRWVAFNGGISETPCGLAWLREWGALRYSANTALIALMAADEGVNPVEYREWAEKQIKFMLGANKNHISYLIGYGDTSPQNPHHRAASCPLAPASCTWGNFNSANPNPHELTGALVGGPDSSGNYEDVRSDYVKNEVTTDYNAAFQSVLSGLISLTLDGNLPKASTKC